MLSVMLFTDTVDLVKKSIH